MKKVAAVEQTKKYYDKEFLKWTNTKTNSFYHEKQFTKIVSLWPEKGTIIDIGCAYGIHVPLFLGIGRHLKYIGIDISKSFLKLATRYYPQLNFQEGNISDIDVLPKKKFDGFFAAAVLMHVPFEHWDVTFENIEKINKSGSFGYITLPVTHPSKNIEPSDARHFTIIPEDEQRTYLKSHGWKIKHSGTMDGSSSKAVWRWYIVELP